MGTVVSLAAAIQAEIVTAETPPAEREQRDAVEVKSAALETVLAKIATAINDPDLLKKVPGPSVPNLVHLN